MNTFYLIGHDSLSPDIGGGTQRLLSIADSLKRRGHSVTLIGPSEKTTLHGIPVIPVLLPRKGGLMLAQIVFFNLQTFRWLLSHRTPRPAIVIHNAIGGLSPALLHVLFKQPYFLDLTDIHAEYFHIEGWPRVSEWIKRLFKYVEIAVIRRADHVIVVSQSMKEYLKRHGIAEERMSVVPDGVDLTLHDSFKTSDSDSHVLHISHTDYLTQVEIFVQAIPQVLKQFPRTVFDLVVRGRGVPAMKRLVNDLGVAPSCRWHASRPRQELKEIFRQARIGIVQRRDMTANQLVVTGKLFDYWASGTAVISTRLSGIEQVTRDRVNILFCNPGSPDSLAKAMIETLQNAELRNRLALEGLAEVKKYDLHQLADRIVAILSPVARP